MILTVKTTVKFCFLQLNIIPTCYIWLPFTQTPRSDYFPCHSQCTFPRNLILTFVRVSQSPHSGYVTRCYLKQLSSRIYLKIICYNFFKISLQIYIIVVRNLKKPTYFLFFALKTDNSLFCHRVILTIYQSAN